MILMFDVGNAMDRLIARFDICPWSSVSANRRPHRARHADGSFKLYTDEQRKRRDVTPWTVVQGVLAPLQFVVFLISLSLVVHYMITGTGFEAATVSIVLKTLVLYTIMVTGAIWERAVFGQYLFAPSFFWEDVVSMLVIALHTAYLVVLVTGTLGPTDQMLLALAAYAAYVINAAQFLLKLRAARLESSQPRATVEGFSAAE